MTKPIRLTCETLCWDFERGDHRCEKPATHWFLYGENYQRRYPVCQDCADATHPSRLRPLSQTESEPTP